MRRTAARFRDRLLTRTRIPATVSTTDRRCGWPPSAGQSTRAIGRCTRRPKARKSHPIVRKAQRGSSGGPSSSTGRAGKGKDRTVAFLVDRYGYACSMPLSRLPRQGGFDATFQGTAPRRRCRSWNRPTWSTLRARPSPPTPTPWRARHSASGSTLWGALRQQSGLKRFRCLDQALRAEAIALACGYRQFP